MTPALDVSVVICCYTLERYDDLLAAVDSTLAQQPRAGELLVVVDHNPELLDRLRGDRPDVQAVPNTRTRGLSGARNSALGLVAGDVVAFLDDDAAAESGWLARLVAPFGDPRVAGTGGRLDPLWEHGRPAWFPHEFDWVVGCSHPGQPAGGGAIRNPIGANMAFRTDLLRQAGGFEESMGRVGTLPVGCEETEISIRISNQHPDVIFWYAPDAVVRHRVPEARGQWRYYRSRCYSEGLSKAMVRTLGGQELGTERTYVREVLRPAVRRELRAARHGDRTAWQRVGALVGGLGATAVGYAVGHSRIKLAARRTAPTAGIPTHYQ